MGERRFLSRAWKALVACNHLVVNAASRGELLSGVCHTVVDELGFKMAWVGTLDEATRRVRVVAHAGAADGYLEKLEIVVDDPVLGAGPTGVALRERRTDVARFIASEARFAPWRSDAVRRGYGSSAAIPLLLGTRVYGVICLYAVEPDAFDVDELTLLEEVALDLLVGLQHFDELDELSRARERLSELDRYAVLGRLAAAATHDFNNLLAVIDSLLGELRELDPDNTRFLALTDDIRDATGRAAKLCRQVLSLTRRAAGASGEVDLDAHLTGMKGILERLAGHEVTLAFDLGAPGARVTVDGTLLEQAIANLVVDARDAMPDGGKLFVRTKLESRAKDQSSDAPELSPGDYVSVSVVDTGTGIAPEVLPRVFAESFTTKGAGGTGIGLATVKRCASEAGGRALIESELGKGTSVIMMLPRVAAAS